MPSASVLGVNSVSRRGEREEEILRRKTGAVLAAEAFFRVGVSALFALAERPRLWAEAVKTGGKGPKNERPRGSMLSASRVNCWVGRSAPDAQAPLLPKR